MTLTRASIRDLLLPGIAGVEGKFDGRVEGDLIDDDDGGLSLTLTAADRTATVRLVSAPEIESGAYKDTFGRRTLDAFSVFDQATRPIEEPT